MSFCQIATSVFFSVSSFSVVQIWYSRNDISIPKYQLSEGLFCTGNNKPLVSVPSLAKTWFWVDTNTKGIIFREGCQICFAHCYIQQSSWLLHCARRFFHTLCWIILVLKRNQYSEDMNVRGLHSSILVSCTETNSIPLHIWNYLPSHYLFARLCSSVFFIFFFFYEHWVLWVNEYSCQLFIEVSQ